MGNSLNEIEKLKIIRESIKDLEGRKPSEEMIWLTHYEAGAHERANDIPLDMTVWDVLEEKLLEYVDITAIEYFKREISRPDFIDNVYTWARTFRAMGVEEDEIVPIYGPFFPDICAMTFALNMIGATSYFLKLAISKEALEEETCDSKVAVVYDGMWENVRDVFSDARFKKILVATPSDAMITPKKEIVSLLNYFQHKKNHSSIPRSSKYVWLDDAKKVSHYYTGDVKVPFVENRGAFINSSSGTTIGGLTKGTVATNESVIAQLLQGYNAKVPFHAGELCLTDFPPTASTALNCLFLLPLYHGMTLINDPRVSEDGVFDMIMKYKPQVTIKTGSFWEAFFRRVEKEIARGKKPDLSFFEMPILGGEGAIPEDYNHWNELMFICGSKVPIFSGCGMSEAFSVTSVMNLHMPKSMYDEIYPVISVGIPYPGLELGVFDNVGNELGYHKRGELWVRGKSVMKKYYRKPELTAKTIDKNGWLHTGDLYHIEEDGRLRIWGRMSDKTNLNDGTEILLFDISNLIMQDEAIKYCIVNPMPLEDGTDALVAHVVFYPNFSGIKEDVYRRIEIALSENMPNVEIAGYKKHELTFSASKTTAKKDRNGLMTHLTGYEKPIGEDIYNLSITKNDETGKHSLQYSKKERPLVLSLEKR